jgi:hypothetical protein
MPRYYLHMSLSSAYIHDHEGVELTNDAAARERAIQDIMAVWKAGIVKRRNPVMCAVVVASKDREIFRVPFVEAPGVLPETSN